MNSKIAAEIVRLEPKVLERVFKAAERHIALKAGRGRVDGRFDQAGRFMPASVHACCHGIRMPSRAYPYSRLVHAKSLDHVCNDYAVGDHATLVRYIIRQLKGELSKKTIVSMANAKKSGDAVKVVLKRVSAKSRT